MKNKIKVLLVYFLWYIWLIIGNIIAFIRWNKKYNNKKIATIYFNRSDRIWDAVISKPFIELAIKFFKENLWVKHFYILASTYNSFIFKDLKEVKIIELNKNITDNYNPLVMALNSIRLLLKNLLRFNKKKQNNFELLIDLMGDPYTLSTYKQISIGPNLFLNNFLLKYSLKTTYVSLKSKNLIESYIDLIEWYFNFNGKFRKYIYDNIGKFISTNSNNWRNILIFVWTKQYRNLSIKKWKELIKELSASVKQDIYVVDDNSNQTYEKLKNISFPSNVRIIKNNFSLPEFKNFAKKFKLLIWVDGGGFNFIRNITNSVTIYTFWNPNVWSLFTWNCPKRKFNLKNNYYFVSTKCKENTFSYIYKKDFFLPSYDIPLWNNYFDDFDIMDFVKQLENIYLNNLKTPS